MVTVTVYVVLVSPVFETVTVTVLVPVFHDADEPLDTAVPLTSIATLAPFAAVALTVSDALLVDAV